MLADTCYRWKNLENILKPDTKPKRKQKTNKKNKKRKREEEKRKKEQRGNKSIQITSNQLIEI